MNLKNYTSGVPIERTIMRIEVALITGGAIGISKEYGVGQLEAIYFSIPSQEKRLLTIRLPANVEAVYQVFKESVKRPRPGTMENLRKQAERTAWKLIQDWVEVQMSIIKMNQAEFLEVFLPYVWDGKQTFFKHLKDNEFKLLTEGTK